MQDRMFHRHQKYHITEQGVLIFQHVLAANTHGPNHDYELHLNIIDKLWRTSVSEFS